MITNPFYSKIELLTKPVKSVEVVSFQKPVDGKYKPMTLINELAPYESIVGGSDMSLRTMRPYLMERAMRFGLFGYSTASLVTLAAVTTSLTTTKTSFYLEELNDKLLKRRADMDGVNPKKYHALDFSKEDIFAAEWCYQYDIMNLLSFVERYKAERGFVQEYGKFNKPNADIYDILDEPDMRELVYRVTKALKNEFISDPISFNRLRKYGNTYTYMTAQQYIPGAVGMIDPVFSTAVTKANITASRNGMTYTIETGTESNLHELNLDSQIGDGEIWMDLYAGTHTLAQLKVAVNGLLNAMQTSKSHELVRSYYRGLADAANRNYEMPAEFVKDDDSTPISKDLAVVNKLRYLPQAVYIEATDDWDVIGRNTIDNIQLEYGAYSPEVSYEEIIERGIFIGGASESSVIVALNTTLDVVYGDRLYPHHASTGVSFVVVYNGYAHTAFSTPPLLSVSAVDQSALLASEEIMHQFNLPFLVGYTTPSVGPDDTPLILYNLRSNQFIARFDYAQATSWITRTVEEFNGGF